MAQPPSRSQHLSRPQPPSPSRRLFARAAGAGLAAGIAPAALAQSARLRPIDATGDRLVFELGRQGS